MKKTDFMGFRTPGLSIATVLKTLKGSRIFSRWFPVKRLLFFESLKATLSFDHKFEIDARWRQFLSSKNEIKGDLRVEIAWSEIFALIKKVSFGSLNVSQQNKRGQKRVYFWSYNHNFPTVHPLAMGFLTVSRCSIMFFINYLSSSWL